MTDTTLGSILFTEFGVASVNLGLCTYFVLTIYVLFSPPLAWVVLIFIIGNGLGVTIAILKLWQLTRVCEQLNECLILAKDHLQGFQVSLKCLYFYYNTNKFKSYIKIYKVDIEYYKFKKVLKKC